MSRPLVLLAVAAAALLTACAHGPRSSTSFFITSANPGKGGDFGGLEGADRYCQSLAATAGAGNRTWRAYLSTVAANGQPAVNARDRIGNGPWFNAKGALVAYNSSELHSVNNITKQTALTEKGEMVNGRGDTPNMHDILTGSTADGRVAAGSNDSCRNWTSSDAGSAIVGHHDRNGTNPDPIANISWNASHGTRGCGMEALKSTGGGGLLYCFAAD
jgi:hypothetical protein